MRHQKQGRKFGRKSGPRHALFSNLVTSLIEHERIQTTDAKAKELRRIADRAINWASSVGPLIAKGDKADADDKAQIVHAMRMARRVVKHRPTLEKLFREVGPRFVGRPGGYTRVLKLGNRHGDAAPISIIELVERAAEAAPETSEKKGAKAAGGKQSAAKAEAKGGAKAAKKPGEKAEAKPAKKAAKKKSES